MTDVPMQIVAVSGLVRNPAGRVLLVRTPRRGWEPPGGQVERGEDLITALEREILEESGCAVRVGRLVGVYSNLAMPPGVVILAFLCEHIGGDPCAGHECTDAGWFTPEQARHLVTHPAVAARLADALADQPGIVYRAYAVERFADPPADGGTPWHYTVVTERRC
jgi:ADP-ribose pyrophosphatase YjhB (NUDIX family)